MGVATGCGCKEVTAVSHGNLVRFAQLRALRK